MKKYFKHIILILLIFSALKIEAQSVYRTPSGKKYNKASCRMVENVSKRLSIEQAKQSGSTPCKICKPPVNISSSKSINSNYNKAKGTQKNSVQCKGRTKKGTRCKHKTHIGNGFCFQHQPK